MVETSTTFSFERGFDYPSEKIKVVEVIMHGQK